MEWYKLFLTELLGTGILVLLGNGIVANVILKGTKGNNSGWLSIAFGWGFAVSIAALISCGLGGAAELNPAVTIALAISDKTHHLGVGGYTGMAYGLLFFFVLVAQIIGAFIGQILLDFVYLPHILKSIKENSNDFVLTMHSTGPTQRKHLFNVSMEFVGTAILLIGILSFSKFNGGSGLAGFYGPILVGIVVIGIGLSLGGTTGYAINPTRDLIPRIVHQLLPIKNKAKSDWSYSWVPVLGPLLSGAVIGLCYLVI